MLKALIRTVGLGMAMAASPLLQAADVTPAEARAIAREAYLYGFPMVESYKTLYVQAVQKGGPDYKAPFNSIKSAASVFTPADKAIVTPNSDTPYSFLWLDLRAEPQVLTLPKVDGQRYMSVQLIDLYTFNFAYLGNRTTGREGGNFLVAGPNWKGETPAGISKVIRSETELAYALYRTQLFGPQDLAAVKALQAGYRVQPLSAFTHGKAPAAAAAVSFPPYEATRARSLGFFAYFNFLLRFCPTHPSEQALFERFARIGIAAGKPFDESKLSAAMRQALQQGIADADAEFAAFKKAKVDTHAISSGEFFGTREFLKNNYLYRYGGARLGIYGNSLEEALYTGYFVDAQGKPLVAGQNRYTVHFAKGQLPPAQAFWSLTMYDGKSQLLVSNPLKRYLINSTMLAQLKTDADGGITLYLQSDSPGKDKESNWLPAPAGPFYAVLRLYQPGSAALSGKWQAPPVQKAP